MIQHLATHCADAASVVFVNFDDQGPPTIVHGVQAMDGWHFMERGPTQVGPDETRSHIISMVMKDTE